MRLWSLHPRYLDTKGLVALWREALLAQAVLEGKTVGYKNHSQLVRFKEMKDPVAGIATYLTEVYKEALRRGYNFDHTKIAPHETVDPVPVTLGQMLFELKWLNMKLETRAPKMVQHDYQAHPMFYVVHGEVESWEKN